MTITKQEIIDYLIKHQGFDEERVKEMTLEELVDFYEMYQED